MRVLSKPDTRNSRIRFKTGVVQPGTPAHIGLCGEQGKRLMGCDEEPVTEFGAGVGSEVIGLFVEVPVRHWANRIASTHLRPIFFKRSSSWRCFSSQ